MYEISGRKLTAKGNCKKTNFISTSVVEVYKLIVYNTRWFKYDRDDLCVNKSQFVPVIFERPCKFVGVVVI